MSASVTYDIMTLLERLGFGTIGRGIYDPLEMAERRPSDGILVEQRTTSSAPDSIVGCDTLYVNIQVRGHGGGERGRNEAARIALDIYNALDLRLDLLINGTKYELISPDTAPYEVVDASGTPTYYDTLLGLEVVRYYRGTFSPDDFEIPLPWPSDGQDPPAAGGDDGTDGEDTP